MYTFCSFYQDIIFIKLTVNCTYLRLFKDKLPIAFMSLNLEVIKSLSAFALLIRALKRRLLDCITSKVVLVFPVSYSNAIPSFAISAAFTWASVALSTLSAD